MTIIKLMFYININKGEKMTNIKTKTKTITALKNDYKCLISIISTLKQLKI
jgi:hypothetical protein